MTRSLEESDLCEVFCFDEAKVRRLRCQVGRAEGLGNLFKALSDETRAKILYCLSQEELCVCDVANIMGMSVQAVSHHLRLLRTMKLVKYRREGKLAFYSLDDAHVEHLISEGLAHVREHRQ
jgi:DNA-binding transcriptional ArsR family regulator